MEQVWVEISDEARVSETWTDSQRLSVAADASMIPEDMMSGAGHISFKNHTKHISETFETFEAQTLSARAFRVWPALVVWTARMTRRAATNQRAANEAEALHRLQAKPLELCRSNPLLRQTSLQRGSETHAS